jgi:hypothetical protein
LITIEQSSFNSTKPTKSKQTSMLKISAPSIAQERFSEVFGGATLNEDGSGARHICHDWDYVRILGKRLYSQGRHVIRFKIEYNENQYNIFFGCISSRVTNKGINYSSPTSAGWFGCNEIYRHAKINYNSYDSSQFRTNDVLSLTFDCEKHQIELYHERKNKTYTLQIDIEKAPFPWRILVVLCRPDNCITILPND